MKCKLLNIRIGNDLNIYGGITLIKYPKSKISIGNNVSIIANKKRATSCCGDDLFRIRTFSTSSRITIDDYCSFGGGGSLSCQSTFIKIGYKSYIGPNIQIVDSDFHSLDVSTRDKPDIKANKGVEIKNNVFIGMNVTILKGVTIGENSIVGANSVVSASLESNSIYAGNPAKFIRKI